MKAVFLFIKFMTSSSSGLVWKPTALEAAQQIGAIRIPWSQPASGQARLPVRPRYRRPAAMRISSPSPGSRSSSPSRPGCAARCRAGANARFAGSPAAALPIVSEGKPPRTGGGSSNGRTGSGQTGGLALCAQFTRARGQCRHLVSGRRARPADADTGAHRAAHDNHRMPGRVNRRIPRMSQPVRIPHLQMTRKLRPICG